MSVTCIGGNRSYAIGMSTNYDYESEIMNDDHLDFSSNRLWRNGNMRTTVVPVVRCTPNTGMTWCLHTKRRHWKHTCNLHPLYSTRVDNTTSISYRSKRVALWRYQILPVVLLRYYRWCMHTCMSIHSEDLPVRPLSCMHTYPMVQMFKYIIITVPNRVGQLHNDIIHPLYFNKRRKASYPWSIPNDFTWRLVRRPKHCFERVYRWWT